MNVADKTELKNLVSGMKKMKKLYEDFNKPYHDENVSRYAKAAIADAEETRDYLVSFIGKNLTVLVNLSRIQIGGGFWGYEGVEAFNNTRKVWVPIGNDLSVQLFVRDFKPVKSSSNEIFISCDPEDVKVVGVKVYTSDTGRPEYNLCAWEDLVFNAHGKYNLEMQTAKGWESILRMANRTKGYAEWLVRALKEAIVSRTEGLKKRAAEAEGIEEKLLSVGVYEKISI